MQRPLRDVALVSTAIFLAIFTFVAMVTKAGGQDRRFARPENPKPACTQTYVDLPLNKLKNAVTALDGLHAEEDQSRLPEFLHSIAQNIATTLPKLPDVISEERVYLKQGQGGLWAPHVEPDLDTPAEIDRYLILFRHAAEGVTQIEESRTEFSGKPSSSGRRQRPEMAYGFANQWLRFSAANQPEFRFRYLGMQNQGRRKTFAIAFAQVPAKVKTPAIFQSEGISTEIYYQGVLWVDQASFDIVRVRSDLLEPIKNPPLKQLKSDLGFQFVKIRGYDAAFWLPVELRITSEQGLTVTDELHRYSDFHLYRTQSKIVPAR